MDIERNCQNRVTGDFLERFKLEKLEFGSENYWAVRKALEIGRMLEKISTGEHQSTSDLLLLKLHKENIDRPKEGILKINYNNSLFTDKFNEICDWMMAESGTMLAGIISWKLGFLEQKIKETGERTDLV